LLLHGLIWGVPKPHRSGGEVAIWRSLCRRFPPLYKSHRSVATSSYPTIRVHEQSDMPQLDQPQHALGGIQDVDLFQLAILTKAATPTNACAEVIDP
jgi:hypothetical protein